MLLDYEKILDGRLREVVDIDKIQDGFMPERGTVDAVFVLRRLSEKFRAENKLFFIFVVLEKAFDRVPREIIRFALRRKGVPEYLVNGVMSLYKGCKKLMSPLMRNYQVHFLWKLVPIKGVL